MMLQDHYLAHNLSKRNYGTIITNTTVWKIPCKTINTTSLLKHCRVMDVFSNGISDINWHRYKCDARLIIRVVQSCRMKKALKRGLCPLLLANRSSGCLSGQRLCLSSTLLKFSWDCTAHCQVAYARLSFPLKKGKKGRLRALLCFEIAAQFLGIF